MAIVNGKSAAGLIAYCEAQLGRPYWMGTFGQVATASIYNYNKQRLGGYYTASDFPSQYGQKVHDCIGLIKGYLWSETPESEPKYASNSVPDVNEAGMYQLSEEKGAISTMPDVPGMLVYLPGHVGVYIGGGEVIEARGHAYGVVKTKLSGRGWQTWGKCPYIDYGQTEVKGEEDMEKIYNTTEDVPDWGKATIAKLVEKKYLEGNGEGLALNDTMLRLLVINDRAGLYD
ncbi:MAG: hypothetical protein LBM18_06020 [Oscillospiraceae bacterium]|jgi:hypothetical protein|nr:hypothetical protein [Oscillospiraceae bacterium]